MKKGSILVGIMIVLSGLMTVGIALSSTVLSSSIKIQRQYKKLSALAYAEAGVNKGLWKINASDLAYATGVNGVLETDLEGGQYRVKITNCPAPAVDCKYIESTGFIPTEAQADSSRTVRVKINGVQNVTNINFSFALQSNNNEVELRNNSTVKGSVYSNGKINMYNKATITGNATSAGSTPTTSYIGTDGSINGSANAYTISGTTVGGTKTTGSYPGQQAPPIPDADLESTISAWEDAAAAGTNYTGTKTYIGNNNEIGPAKITGDLNVDGDLKIKGVVWVSGNINIAKDSHIYLDSSYGDNSGVIIADDRLNRSTSGKITIGHSAYISGTQRDNPKTTSYLMMFSTKTSTPANWNTDAGYAIELANVGVQGGVYYAPFGSYHQKNHGQIRAVASNGLVLDQNASIDYDGNWGNSGISSGPGGKWTITEWLILN